MNNKKAGKSSSTVTVLELSDAITSIERAMQALREHNENFLGLEEAIRAIGRIKVQK